MAATLVLNPSMMFTGAASSLAAAAAVGNSSGLPAQMHVLLVDDEKISRVVVGNLLRKCNYRVTAIEGGREALRVLNTSPPGTFDLILSDVMMPDLNGIDLLREVRKLPFLEAVPVVMMSVNEAQQQVLECIKGGADEYLVKPVTKKEVQNIWQHVWKRTQSRVGDGSKPESTCDIFHLAPGAAARPERPRPGDAAVSGLRASRSSGEMAGGRHHVDDAAAAAAGPVTGDVGASDKSSVRRMLLSQWLIKRKLADVVNAQRAALRVFCEVLLMVHTSQLSPHHVHGRIRPSSLFLHEDVSVTFAPDAFMNSTYWPEDEAYRSPEEVGQEPVTERSDVYALGVLFFELFLLPFVTEGSRAQHLAELRTGNLPADLLNSRAQECAFVMSLIHRIQDKRPSLASLLASDQFSVLCKQLRQLHQQRQQQAAADIAVVTEFLSMVHEHKSQEVQQLEQNMQLLDQDIAAVTKELDKRTSALRNQKAGLMPRIPALGAPRDATMSGADIVAAAERAEGLLLKRKRTTSTGLLVDPGSMLQEATQAPSTKWQRIMVVFSQLEQLYFDRRTGKASTSTSLGPPAAAVTAAPAVPTITGGMGGASVTPEAQHASGSSDTRRSLQVPALEQQQQRSGQSGGSQPTPHYHPLPQQLPAGHLHPSLQHNSPPASTPLQQPQQQHAAPSSSSSSLASQLLTFSHDLWKFSQHSSLRPKATVRYGDLMNSSNMVCSLAFDKDEEFFATAGVSKRLKIFEYATVVDSNVMVHYPVLEINSRSKLTSVCWSGHIKSHLVCADSEGIVQLWDANNNTELMHFEEHSKRVWSVDVSRLDLTRIVSGSDDGTVKLWQINQEQSTATISFNQANVCSVHFSPTSEHMIACGCANYNVYLYDLRNTSVSLAAVPGHARAVSYVRFMDGNRLVSASIDGTLKLWNVRNMCAGAQEGCEVTYRGHRNEKNFVGLSVTPEGYIACGSEDNAVYCYYQGMPMPVLSYDFDSADLNLVAVPGAAGGSRFVSSVCWSTRNNALLAGNTTGAVQVLTMQ